MNMSLGYVSNAVRMSLTAHIELAHAILEENDVKDLEQTFEMADEVLSLANVFLFLNQKTLTYVRSHNAFERCFKPAQGFILSSVVGWYKDHPVVTDENIPPLKREWPVLSDLKVMFLKAEKDHYDAMCSYRPG